MRLMIDASLQSVGGGVQVAVNFINQVIETGFAAESLIIVSPQVDKQINPIFKNNKNYIVIKNSRGIFKFFQGYQISKLEKEFNPDLVFIVFGPSYWKPKSKSIQGFAISHMVYKHISETLYKKNFFKKILFKILIEIKKIQILKNYQYMVVETEIFKKLVVKELNFNPKNIYVIENTFNSLFNKFQNNNGKIAYGIEDKKNINFFVPSAYYLHKNLEILIDVAFILNKKYNTYLKFNFLIEKNSSEWARMKQLAKEKGVLSYINTYGSVDNIGMAELYMKNDFVILPTLVEVSTAVYPESFMSRKLIFTSDLDFARELCGDSAIYFNPWDPEDIALKIVQIIDNVELQNKLIHLGLSQLRKKYISPEEKWNKQKRLINLILSNKI